ncbi:DAK2 domain-containing protein [Streptomyces sp. NPDC002092]
MAVRWIQVVLFGVVVLLVGFRIWERDHGDGSSSIVFGLMAASALSIGVRDKTMIDAFSPAVTTYQAVVHTGGDLVNATRAAHDAAVRGLKQTADMQARKGRASYLGARSIGHVDPGAASTVLILSALATVCSGGERRTDGHQ